MSLASQIFSFAAIFFGIIFFMLIRKRMDGSDSMDISKAASGILTVVTIFAAAMTAEPRTADQVLRADMFRACQQKVGCDITQAIETLKPPR